MTIRIAGPLAIALALSATAAARADIPPPPPPGLNDSPGVGPLPSTVAGLAVAAAVAVAGLGVARSRGRPRIRTAALIGAAVVLAATGALAYRAAQAHEEHAELKARYERQLAGWRPAGPVRLRFAEPPAPAAEPSPEAKHAIEVAERFVRDNGYTDLAPEDPASIKPESLQFGDDPKQWLEMRRGTLRPRAYGYKPGGRSGAEGWAIAFEYTNPTADGKGLGRAVTMDASGANLRMEHQDCYLDRFQRRP
jgi:hypothetical protein